MWHLLDLLSTGALIAVLVAVLVVGLRRRRRDRRTGVLLIAASALWLLAIGVHRAEPLLAQRLFDDAGSGWAVVLAMLGETAYFGLSGLGLIGLFLALASGRTTRSGDSAPAFGPVGGASATQQARRQRTAEIRPRDDGDDRRDPFELAGRAAGMALDYHRRRRGRRSSRVADRHRRPS